MKTKSHQRGFAMIQIILAIIASISVVSGTAFVAYEAGQEAAENTTQPTTATTTAAEIESVPDGAVAEDEATPDAGVAGGEPSEPMESDATSAPSTELTTATTSAPASTEVSETAPIETGTSTSTSASASVDITTTPRTTSSPASTTQNFKEPALALITALLNSYDTTTKWIDGSILPLLSERERMIDGLISNTQTLIASNPDSLVLYVYSLFVDAYNLDKNQVVGFYRDKFSEIMDNMNSEAVSILKAEHEKFSVAPSVSEAEYNALIQPLKQYEDSLKSNYTNRVMSIIVEYMGQTGSKDELYQQAWAELSIIASDSGNSTQNLESIVERFRFVQPTPLN